MGYDDITVEERVCYSLREIFSAEDARKAYDILLADGLLVSDAAVIYLEGEDG